MSKKKSKLTKILFIPDTHRPYHDTKAWALMLKAAKAFKPDRVIVGGDFSDCYTVSAHSKDPQRALKLDWEIEDVNTGLDEIQSLGAKHYDFVEGNHEDRLRRYLQDKAPELMGQITIPKLFKLKERGFSFTPYKHTLKIGKLNVTHDLGNAGRYAHYKALDTVQHNIVINHVHRIGYAVEGNADGARHVTATFGWLGDLDAIDYMHKDKARKDWSLGFGIGYLDEQTGYIYIIPVPIIEYTCLIEGVLYK